MRILVINPNSSVQMTDDIASTVTSTLEGALEGVYADVVRMKGAPQVLESYADYAVAASEMISFTRAGGAEGYDGVLVSCFGDPGLAALKELLDVPCIGIAEASMSRALLLGGRFSILAASVKAGSMMERLVDEYGLQTRNAGTVSLQAPIESFLGDPRALSELIEQALDGADSGADVLIYGCAGMTALSARSIEEARGIAVIDPVACGLTTLMGLAASGARISRSGLFASPS